MAINNDSVGFEDFLPSIARRLGGEGLMRELCEGFDLLMDSRKGLITVESLRANASWLGIEGFGEEELMGMLREGDLDGDGALDRMEFCVLMVRLSPEMMKCVWWEVEEAFVEVMTMRVGF